MNEIKFANRIRRALNEGARLHGVRGERIAERLRAARERALERRRIAHEPALAWERGAAALATSDGAGGGSEDAGGFSLRLLLASKGLINQSLVGLGIIDAPFDFLGSNAGLYIGLSYAYLLVMIFPLYNAIESLDKNQIEAARDLGAPWWKIHRDVVMPYAKPGIASGCTMVFMLSAGALAAPQFLGGPNTLWFTSIVYDFFFQAFNWPRGAAYAFILLAACIAFVMATLKLFKVSLGETFR